MCVLNMLLASEPFSEQQLQELQQQSPAAIGADGRFSTLKALSQEAKVEPGKTKVRGLGRARAVWAWRVAAAAVPVKRYRRRAQRQGVAGLLVTAAGRCAQV